MRAIAAIFGALALSAQSPPKDTLDGKLARFDQALSIPDTSAASAIIDELIVSRMPADGVARPDPLLNSLIGRFYLTAQQEGPAAEYLSRAKDGELPASIRAETLLAYGDSLQLLGRRAEALAAYQSAKNAPANPRQQSRASLGVARQLLVTDPDGARRGLAPLLSGARPEDRWEAEYLSALASSLLGDVAGARGFADRAWSDAAAAPPAELAPLHVSVLRAGLATMAGDKNAQRAMLLAANAMSATRGGDLGSQLPVCGDDGVRPSDHVVFGAIRGPYNTNALVPIAATRPEIVKAFYDKLAGREAIEVDNQSTATGTVVTMSCVTKVDSGYEEPRPFVDPMFAWFAEHGSYPVSAKFEASDEWINKVGERVDELKRRYGADSVLLAQPNWQLLAGLEARAAAGGDVPPGRLVELRGELAAGLRKAGAPEWMGDMLSFRTDLERLTRSAAATGKPDFKTFLTLWNELLQKSPFPISRVLMQEMLNSSKDSLTSAQITSINDLRRRAPVALAGRDLQAFLQKVANAQRAAGFDTEARQTAAATGLPQDFCARTDNPPKLLEQPFTSKDYPTDLVPAEIKGYSLVELSVTPSGNPSGIRTVLSIPSGLFDEVTTKGASAMQFSKPAVNGKARPCRAQTQGVQWRLEEEGDFDAPTLLPDTTKEST